MRNARVLLLGYGFAGSVFHAPLIAATPGLELAGIVTARNQERARRGFPQARLYARPDLAWKDDYDLAVVATPNDSHAPLAQQALRTMPVVVDKPLAARVDDALALLEASRRHGHWLTVFQNRRWDSDFLTLQSLRSRLGDIQRFESRFERWRPSIKPGWRESGAEEVAGGVLFDLGAHLIDQALLLFGPPLGVYAEVGRRRADVQVDDDTFVALHHARGVQSHLWMSSVAGHIGPRLRVLGSQGAYLKIGLDIQESQLKAGLDPLEPAFGQESPEHWGHFWTGDRSEAVASQNGGYRDFYRQVALALQGQGPPPVDPADAVQVLKVIEKAFRSAREGAVIPF